ncbi:hypothetical protein E2C01_081977 [Portunus trituberculatus]|uniref:Uncharacterized protein n=1 Tax=Portunus trituberculatus TaxID=210409 RepID=A0A5B7IZK0_PORTR|nr:hypothetical protein [Portunus trituberculatus]
MYPASISRNMIECTSDSQFQVASQSHMRLSLFKFCLEIALLMLGETEKSRGLSPKLLCYTIAECQTGNEHTRSTHSKQQCRCLKQQRHCLVNFSRFGKLHELQNKNCQGFGVSPCNSQLAS